MTERKRGPLSATEQVNREFKQRGLEGIGVTRLARLVGSDFPIVFRIVKDREKSDGIQIVPGRDNTVNLETALMIAGWIEEYKKKTVSSEKKGKKS